MLVPHLLSLKGWRECLTSLVVGSCWAVAACRRVPGEHKLFETQALHATNGSRLLLQRSGIKIIVEQQGTLARFSWNQLLFQVRVRVCASTCVDRDPVFGIRASAGLVC